MMFNPSSRHVLVVEDEPTLASMLTQVLENDGYSAEWTPSAKEALALARRRTPVIVVCDVILAEGDGRKLLHDMRADPALAGVQFVLMTGNTEEATQRSGMDLGANDYLAKPFTLEAFRSCIEARCRQAALSRKIEQSGLDRIRNTIEAIMPHEFFTPLAGIIGLSELLIEGWEDMPAKQSREHLGDIRESARRLHRSLENYLLILRLRDGEEGRGQERRKTPLSDLSTAFETAVATVAQRYGRTDDLQVTGPSSDARGWLTVDGRELAKIVSELVDNACKFSQPDQVVTARLEAEEGHLQLTVTDQGRGMAAAEIAQIGAFRQFHRDHFEQQGLGLGLTLAQYIVQGSGGAFAITSQPGEGATVTATWPMEA